MSERGRFRRVEHVMGTVFSFDVRAEGGARTCTAVEEAVRWLHRVDELFSTYRPQSQVSRLARHEVSVAECDSLVAEALRLCDDAELRSGGWFSARYAGDGGLDPTGLVKGWAVECASRMLAAAGLADTCVNGGGDVQLRGHREPRGPWRVGISDPLRPGRLATVVEGAEELAVATSGIAERGCHVVDPHTGALAGDELASMTVVARGLTEADAWATAAFAMGNESRAWLEELPGVEAFAVAADGRTWCTRGFGRFTAS